MIILIADDDRLVRFTVKSILRELLGDTDDIFLETANGRDMVSLCAREKPDIAFVDISMPYLNGLEAIAESRKASPHTKYVIISGYSDFAYAQQGIRLGVAAYLLKPLDVGQMEEIMEQLQLELRKQKQEHNSKFQLRVMNAFNYYTAVGAAENEEEIVRRGQEYLVVLLYVRAGGKREDSLMLQKRLVGEIGELGEGVVVRKGHYAVTNTSEGNICIVFDVVSQEMKEYVLRRIRKISEAALGEMREGKQPECFHYFRWFSKNTLTEVFAVCERLDAQTHLLGEWKNGAVREYSGRSKGEYESGFLRQIEDLLDAWKQADGIACKEIINGLWRKYKDRAPEIDLHSLSAYCSAVCGCPIESQSLHHFFRSFVEYSEQMYSGTAVEENDMIEQVKAYIQKYYTSDISISQIAEHFGLTANYLSTLFHRKAGCKFIDYLTEVRMEAAKRLLIQNGTASVQDIALMVGYNSARHFSSLFQKQTGETPSAYRKSNMAKRK